MLWESSKMEQLYDAVLGVIRDGFTLSDLDRSVTWYERVFGFTKVK